MSILLYLSIALSIVLLSIECSVIRVQEVPLTNGVVMKVVIKEDPNHSGNTVATLKIEMENKKNHNLANPLDKLKTLSGDVNVYNLANPLNNVEKPTDDVPVYNIAKTSNKFEKPTGDVPVFEDRLLIKDNKCGLGQVRRGPVCV